MDEKMIHGVEGLQKKAQITIFIILALLIIGSVIILLFMMKKPQPRPEVISAGDFRTSLASCIRPHIHETLNLIMEHGGYINPKLYKLYNNIPIAYLCYTRNYYEACINQEPLLIEHIEEELHNYLEPEIERCFSETKEEFEKRGYVINMGKLSFDVWLKPRNVEIYMERKVTLSRGEATQKFSDFKIKVQSPIYELTNIAEEIASSEAKYCYFESLGFTVFYHNKFEISRDILPDSSKIYSIKDVQSNKVMNIAIRSCAIPPGF